MAGGSGPCGSPAGCPSIPLSADEALVVLGLFEIGVAVHAHVQVILLAQLVQNVVFGLAFVLHCEPLPRSS